MDKVEDIVKREKTLKKWYNEIIHEIKTLLRATYFRYLEPQIIEYPVYENDYDLAVFVIEGTMMPNKHSLFICPNAIGIKVQIKCVTLEPVKELNERIAQLCIQFIDPRGYSVCLPTFSNEELIKDETMKQKKERLKEKLAAHIKVISPSQENKNA